MTEGVEVYVFSLLHPRKIAHCGDFSPFFSVMIIPPKPQTKKRPSGLFLVVFYLLSKPGV